MEVIKKFPETMDARTQFKMMKSPEVKKMIDAEDSVLTLETVDGEMFGTISEPFMKAFEEIVSFFGDDVGSIKVITGNSKAGRKYVTCTVA